MCRSLRLATLLVLAACATQDNSFTLPEELQSITGSAQILVTTSGPNPDPDGYVAVLDEERSAPIDANGQLTFSGLTPGNYQATLEDVAENCAIQGAAVQSFYVEAAVTKSVSFAVTCS